MIKHNIWGCASYQAGWREKCDRLHKLVGVNFLFFSSKLNAKNIFHVSLIEDKIWDVKSHYQQEFYRNAEMKFMWKKDQNMILKCKSVTLLHDLASRRSISFALMEERAHFQLDKFSLPLESRWVLSENLRPIQTEWLHICMPSSSSLLPSLRTVSTFWPPKSFRATIDQKHSWLCRE